MDAGHAQPATPAGTGVHDTSRGLRSRL